LDWPWIVATATSRYRLYFRRLGDRNSQSAPQYFECVASFPELRERFGEMSQSWRSKRESLGPGLYLYLGTQRGVRMYVEHRFVNLVWGIEAFHRRTYMLSPTSRLKQKIDRILAQVSAKKDKDWLEKKLENAHEPSLGERIFETLNVVPLGLEEARLRAFANRCGKLRNDFAHFGGQRHTGGSYDDFLLGSPRASRGAGDSLSHVALSHVAATRNRDRRPHLETMGL
jgi:hypothetical protein